MFVGCCLLFFSFFNLATSWDACSSDRCYDNYQMIKFPFRIEDNQSESCGYPGFDVFCSITGPPLLHLPPSGIFNVQHIDYLNQEIWINDPDNCLPRKILSLNLSGSPFSMSYNENFTFFNCSGNITVFGLIAPIACLSGSSYSVFGAYPSTFLDFLSSTCDKIKTVSVPTQWSYSSNLMDDMRLKWENPNCRSCETIGGRCGFKPNSSDGILCTNVPQSHRLPRIATVLLIVVAMPVVLVFSCILGSLFARLRSDCRRERNSVTEAHWTTPSQPTATMGLSRPTIASYPKIVLGQSLLLPGPNDDTCPICLAQYRPRETVKSIPQCRHCFHQRCLDEWLRLNPSCPVCRKNPTKSQPSNPP